MTQGRFQKSNSAILFISNAPESERAQMNHLINYLSKYIYMINIFTNFSQAIILPRTVRIWLRYWGYFHATISVQCRWHLHWWDLGSSSSFEHSRRSSRTTLFHKTRHSHANLGTTRLQFCINICLTLFSGFDRVVSSWMHFTQRVLCERSIRPYVPLPEKSPSKAGLETYNSLPSIRPFRKGIYL